MQYYGSYLLICLIAWPILIILRFGIKQKISLRAFQCYDLAKQLSHFLFFFLFCFVLFSQIITKVECGKVSYDNHRVTKGITVVTECYVTRSQSQSQHVMRQTHNRNNMKTMGEYCTAIIIKYQKQFRRKIKMKWTTWLTHITNCKSLGQENLRGGQYHDLAKWLTYYLFFFSFGLTTHKKCGKVLCHKVSQCHVT